MSVYSVAHIIHLFCAITFVGGVLFESLVLSVLHTKKVSREARREAERALSAQAVKVMPWVVGLLFLSGLVMMHRYLQILHNPFANSFFIQLSIKLLLAFSILCHFLAAVIRMHRHTMTVAFSKYIHRAVLVQMLLIVFLAKAMFYIAW